MRWTSIAGSAVNSFFAQHGLVKICGLREPVHARAAVAAGADLLGFIFAPARRRVTAADARSCVGAARDEAGTRRILTVGVFVDATAADMNAAAAMAGLDLLQLHGEEPPELLADLDRPVVKALRPRAGTSPQEAESVIERYLAARNAPVAFLVDGYDPISAGGQGVRADWRLAADLAGNRPLFLAGGLDPDNVASAIAAVRPLAVDVSSGVETAGVKDQSKIEAFVLTAKRAFGLGR